MLNILLVGVGGFIGAAARYLAVMAVNRFAMSSLFPYGTLFVNVFGCLMIGFLGGMAANRQFLAERSRLLVFTGILGGFTTFSAFGLETFFLVRTFHGWMAVLNVLLQLILGLSATALGYWFSKNF